jgi:hypothetical protein
MIAKLAMQDTVLLPTTNVLDGVEGKVLPVLDAGLFVEDGWGRTANVVWGVATVAIGGGEGGSRGRELVRCYEREQLEKEGLGFVKAMFKAFYVALGRTSGKKVLAEAGPAMVVVMAESAKCRRGWKGKGE